MHTRETYLRDLVVQMLKVNHEIMVLAFRVEEAVPEVRRGCYQHVRILRACYTDVESMVQPFIEGQQDEAWSERYSEIDCALQELVRLLDCEGTAIRERLSDKVYLTEVAPRPVQEDVRTETRNKESQLQVTVRRRGRKRLMPLENWMEGELWSRKKIT